MQIGPLDNIRAIYNAHILLVLPYRGRLRKTSSCSGIQYLSLQLIRFLAERHKHQGMKIRLCHNSEMSLIFKQIKEKSYMQSTGLINLPKMALKYKYFKGDLIK